METEMAGLIPYRLAREVASDVYGLFSGAIHGIIPTGWELDTTFNSTPSPIGNSGPGELALSGGFFAYALKPQGIDGRRILAFRGTELTRLTDLYADTSNIGMTQFA